MTGKLALRYGLLSIFLCAHSYKVYIQTRPDNFSFLIELVDKYEFSGWNSVWWNHVIIFNKSYFEFSTICVQAFSYFHSWSLTIIIYNNWGTTIKNLNSQEAYSSEKR